MSEPMPHGRLAIPTATATPPNTRWARPKMRTLLDIAIGEADLPTPYGRALF